MTAPAPVVWFGLAAAAYTANVALGAAVASRRVDTSRVRWVHHGLYTGTSVLAGAAASSLLWSPGRAGWWLLPAAVPLTAVARVSARSRWHPVVALSAAPFVVAALVRAIQEHHGVS